MIRPAVSILLIAVLTACGGSRRSDAVATDQATSDATTERGAAATATSDRDFDRRFAATKVKQSKLLPQLTAPGERSPETRAKLQREAAEILDELRALDAADITRAQRRKVRTEITNLENMVAMYLPAG